MPELKLHITKMHGIGNDFVIVENLDVDNSILPLLARKLCDRHFGIGADGLLILAKSDIADARMRIINADGSDAEMCGNGIRCISKYIYENRLTKSLEPTIETDAGPKKMKLHLDDHGKVDNVTVDMGQASLTDDNITIPLDTECGTFNVIPVSIGNPHAVVVVEQPDDINITTLGPILENHPIWPDRANIEFVSIASPNSVIQRTWERGVGETLACGTGACATAFALTSAGLAAWPITVCLPGGNLSVDLDTDNNHILMTGKAEFVFSTEISITI